MPTSRLIDINTAAITYRTKCLMALDKKLYRNCIGAIFSLNAELPEDDGDKKYRIVIDNDLHYDTVKQSYVIQCNHCTTTKDKTKNPTEFPYHETEFFDVMLPKFEQILTGKNSERIWLCKKCGKENRLLESKIIQNTLQKPYYHRVVPEPPKVKYGLLSHMQFHQDMINWVWLCLNAIEEGFTRYRDDNWNRSDDQYDMYEIDTTIEESE